MPRGRALFAHVDRSLPRGWVVLWLMVATVASADPRHPLWVPADVARASAEHGCRAAAGPLWTQEGTITSTEVERWAEATAVAGGWLAGVAPRPEPEDLWGFETPSGLRAVLHEGGAQPLALQPGEGAAVWGAWPGGGPAHCVLFVAAIDGPELLVTDLPSGRAPRRRRARALRAFASGVPASERRALHMGWPAASHGLRALDFGEVPYADALVESDTTHSTTAATWATAVKAVGARGWRGSHAQLTDRLHRHLSSSPRRPMRAVVQALRHRGAIVRTVHRPTATSIRERVDRGAVVIATVKWSGRKVQVVVAGTHPEGLVVLHPSRLRPVVVGEPRFAAMMASAGLGPAWALRKRASVSEPRTEGRRRQLLLAALLAGLAAHLLYRWQARREY